MKNGFNLTKEEIISIKEELEQKIYPEIKRNEELQVIAYNKMINDNIVILNKI
jgi:hypothetical protein